MSAMNVHIYCTVDSIIFPLIKFVLNNVSFNNAERWYYSNACICCFHSLYWFNTCVSVNNAAFDRDEWKMTCQNRQYLIHPVAGIQCNQKNMIRVMGSIKSDLSRLGLRWKSSFDPKNRFRMMSHRDYISRFINIGQNYLKGVQISNAIPSLFYHFHHNFEIKYHKPFSACQEKHWIFNFCHTVNCPDKADKAINSLCKHINGGRKKKLLIPKPLAYININSPKYVEKLSRKPIVVLFFCF